MNETLFLPAGDSAVNVEFGRTIDPEINKKIRSLSDSLSRKPIRGVTECIPTFRSLLVCYDPLQTGCEALIKKLKKRIKSLDQVSGGEKRVFNIPVCYGGEFGEDIAFVASHAGLTEQEVIDIHTGFRLGYICDVELDDAEGRVVSLITPGRAKLFGLLGREDDYVLPWSCIVKVGSDIVLIEAKGEFMRRKRQHRLF